MYIYSRRKRQIKKYSILIAVAVIGLLVIIKFIKYYKNIEVKDYNYLQAEKISMTIKEKNEEDKTITQMLENVTNSVVGISKIKDKGNIIFTENGVSEMGIGSGVIISEKGYILTNEHVSGEKNSTCYVTMEDGKTFNANVVWSDSSLDLSIIKINMKCINFVKLGDSDAIKVGESVYAIGNPIGFEFQKTVTSGIISALNRTILFKENTQNDYGSQKEMNEKEVYMSNLIQTDATINPGNSGGPLVNNNGEIIGINTVKITSAEGIGFAVPINVIKPIVEKLEKDGKFEEASIGIFAYDKNVIPYLDSKINFNNGIYIAQISLDSVAFNSGLNIGDIITKIDNNPIDKMCDLRKYIYSKKIGDTVNLTILRNNRERNVEVKLGRK